MKAECTVRVVPKLVLDKETVVLLEGGTAEIKVAELSEGASIWGWCFDEEGKIRESEILEIVGADNEETLTVKAVKQGKQKIYVWAAKKFEDGSFKYWSKTVVCTVEVKSAEVAPVEVETPEISEEAKAELGENAEAVVEEIATQTAQIQEAVNAAVEEAKDKVQTSEEAKEAFAEIEAIPEDSELKLLSVEAEVEVEKDENGVPVLDESGAPVVYVKTLTYDISVVTGSGEVLPHDAMKGNTKPIGIDVPLPAKGIKTEWRFATIKHYTDESLKTLLETLYSRIYGSGDSKYITIKTKTFSPFVLEFTVDNQEPVTPPSHTSSGGSGGGGGSSSGSHSAGTNSYSMTGNWVAGADGWTFVKSNGQKAANAWGWINGQYYYFDANGVMMTGWQLINDKWYYLNTAEGSVQGAMLTGVIFDPAYNAYFYADASGAMVTGWCQIGANWYYFSPVNDGVHVTGQLLADTYVDGYYLGADGAWVQGN